MTIMSLSLCAMEVAKQSKNSDVRVLSRVLGFGEGSGEIFEVPVTYQCTLNDLFNTELKCVKVHIILINFK